MVPDLDFFAERLDEESLKSLIACLKCLNELEFFTGSVAWNNQILLGSFESESPDELAKKILETRQTNRVLLAISELAQNYQERKNHA